MVTLNTNKETLYLGVDGGGSKCRAVLYGESSGILGEGLSGPANPLHGFEQSLFSICESADKAILAAGLSPDVKNQLVVGLGLAGVNLPALHQKIEQWQHPFKQAYVTTDLHVACVGAHRGGDGAVIITGTGSCGFASVKGETLTLGAHGFPHGDKGSGAWIGLQAVEHCLLEFDQLASPSVLREKMAATDALSLVEKVAQQPPRFYARLAPLVFEAADENDPVAIKILKQGAEYIDALAQRLFQLEPPRFSMIGGLTTRLIPWLSTSVVDRISDPLDPPEIGAVYFAQQKHQKKEAS